MQFELDALPTVMFFKKGDVKGAIYEGDNDPAKIADFVNEGIGRAPVRTKVNIRFNSFNFRIIVFFYRVGKELTLLKR